MEEKFLKELRMIKKLLAMQAIQNKDFREQIIFLNSIGFQPKEIAEMVNSTSNSVSVSLHKIRKGGKNG